MNFNDMNFALGLMFAAFSGAGSAPLWIRPWSFPLPRFPPLLFGATFPLLHFPPLSSGATFSTPAFSAPPDSLEFYWSSLKWCPNKNKPILCNVLSVRHTTEWEAMINERKNRKWSQITDIRDYQLSDAIFKAESPDLCSIVLEQDW